MTVAEQPLPRPGREPVTEALIDLLRARSVKGLETYGSPLMTENGRDALLDALEEAVDLSQYLMQARLERQSEQRAYDTFVHAVYLAAGGLLPGVAGDRHDRERQALDAVRSLRGGPAPDPKCLRCRHHAPPDICWCRGRAVDTTGCVLFEDGATP